ncbi:MAG: hypothetical protein KDC05_08060 [Bacteroidales bacterium]|nr:hypothetical protein [Bacteroidales bacterium]
MKKFLTVCFVVLLFLLVPVFTGQLSADNPPDPGGGPTGDPVGGGSPVGSGLVILMSLGATYGMKKIYNLKNKIQ